MTTTETELPSLALTSATRRRRRIVNRVMTGLLASAFVVALLPLISVLWLTIGNGAKRLDSTFLTHSMRGIGARDAGGGAYHAILGTLEQVGLASLMAVPLALLTAIYLVEYGGRSRFARGVSYVVDVMTGVPSIVAGLFVFTFWILALKQPFSGFAGALALTILMIPIIVRGSEEMIRLVPAELREASYALGIPRWRTILRIVLPTALPGLVTVIMLGIARITGETAPLLLTVFGADAINSDPFHGPQSGLPLFVFDQAGRPTQAAVDRAWAGALTLILIVMALNLIARLAVRSRGSR